MLRSLSQPAGNFHEFAEPLTCIRSSCHSSFRERSKVHLTDPLTVVTHKC